MKKKYIALMPLLLAVLTSTLGSCDSYESETSTSSDCIVTSATLGTLKRIIHTEASDGSDSTYTISFVGASYPLNIDQVNARIYNPDSLPVGTVVSRTVFSAFSTTGVPGIRSLSSNTDSTFTYTDSTDCSVDRLITVYAYDGTSTKTYTLSLNVHTEAADSFNWTRVLDGDATLQTLEGAHRIYHQSGKFLVYGTQSGTPVVLSADEPGNWTVTALPSDFAPTSVVANADVSVLYALSQGDVCTSTDGVAWTAVGATTVPDGLLAVGTTLLAGIKDGAFYSSADGGVTWTADGADEPDYAPTSNLCGLMMPSTTDPETEYFVAAGLDANNDSAAWRRAIDLTGTYTFDWYYMTPIANYEENYRRLTEPTMVSYDDCSVVTGLTTDGLIASIFVSRDNGRTWKDDIIETPVTAATTEGHVSITADSDNYLWIMESTTGSLWRGRYNRLGWEEEQNSFESANKKDLSAGGLD
ncbi:MAG: DUF6242 domain-containing protein [Bacteroidales bacterium]|nr:DUF6242 domain-containing protein [Bacteroidales bacterium]